jgi:CRP/FNR family transcriptional regulator
MTAAARGGDGPACDAWHSADECLPCGLASLERAAPGLQLQRRRVPRGETLFRQGERCTGLHVIRTGWMKSTCCAADGLEQVTGFHLGGDVLGLESLAMGLHMATVTALEDAEVTILSAPDPAWWTDPRFALQQPIGRLLGRQIVRERGRRVLSVHGTAEQRIAGFLLDLSARMQARGYSAREFVLRMSRREIGDYLGLKLETVSRTLHGLQHQRMLRVDGKHVHITDLDALRRGLALAAP